MITFICLSLVLISAKFLPAPSLMMYACTYVRRVCYILCCIHEKQVVYWCNGWLRFRDLMRHMTPMT
jgi:hypothetical protein